MKLTIRIWIIIIALVLSVLAIKPSFESGVLVQSVDKDSEAFKQGLRQGEIIKSVNGDKVSNLREYSEKMSSLFPQKQAENIRVDIATKKTEYTLFINKSPDITVKSVPKTRIKTGLDIQGGARALLLPEKKITDEQLQDLIAISSNRFNVFGITDVKIRGVSDLAGNKFMLVEVAGATPADLEELVAKQGKFEAKIGNETAFVGGNQDIISVCRNDAQCAAVTGCFPSNGGYVCNFAFTIYLSEEAAKRHAEITKNIPVEPGTGYLAQNLTLILDDIEVDTLRISSNLKGRTTTEISIQGSGQGQTQEEALKDARASMNKLQTVLITGSLPYKLEIVKLDTISPVLGESFIYLLTLAGVSAIAVVGLVVFFRYRKFKASLAILFTSFSETIIILGVASLISWNLDLPSIAGILATIGTGVDQQIVILDEARRNQSISIKERMRRAIFIVFSAYVTALVSLLPLYWAGAGLFKGFAITTIIGITAGVFISRPAFADMIKKIEGDS